MPGSSANPSGAQAGAGPLRGADPPPDPPIDWETLRQVQAANAARTARAIARLELSEARLDALAPLLGLCP